MNMLSSYVFNVSLQTKTIPNCTVSRSQLFELTAAFLGEKSHAALKQTSLNKSMELAKNDMQAAFIRCQERAISFNQTTKVAQKLTKLIRDQLVTLLEKSSVLINQQALHYLTVYESDWSMDYLDDDELEEVTSDTAEAFSFKGFEVDIKNLYNQLQQASKDGDKESTLLQFIWVIEALSSVSNSESSQHWYEQTLKGQKLAGIQKQWADNYAKQIEPAQSFQFFMDQTDISDLAFPNIDHCIESGDFEIIQDSICYLFDADEMLHLIRKYWGEDYDDDFNLEPFNQWLKLSALQRPQRELIAEFIERNEDLIEQHSWARFAKSLGIDVTQDDHYAIDTNTGKIWDADHDAPIEICGYDGVKLQILPHELESKVQARTQVMFELSKKLQKLI
jgi:hypothetical protein|tara:strand:+ start:73861 stop:75036 length:1176 start_codon:yes stop_codon:yes gene_type:complete